MTRIIAEVTISNGATRGTPEAADLAGHLPGGLVPSMFPRSRLKLPGPVHR